MKDFYCANCGKHGHLYKNCMNPIMSYGIVLYKFNDVGVREYLMVRRKHTLGFVEFMRGKYSIENADYLKRIYSIMTMDERIRISELDFDTLWDELWINKTKKQYFNEYDNSKRKFYRLKMGMVINDEYIDLKEINNIIKCEYIEPEWGFPKGRRNLHESDFDCAKREFEEETGLSNAEYKITGETTFCESFFGTNNIRYRHIYYIAKLTNYSHEFIIDKNNYSQYSEIGDISWFTIQQTLNIIRSYNTEKKNMIDIIHKKLTAINTVNLET